MTLKKCLGLFIGLVGFIPVLATKEPQGESLSGGFGFFSWAEIALIGAAACAMYGWVLLRHLGKNLKMEPIIANGISMLIGGICAIIHSAFTDKWVPFPISNYYIFFGSISIMVIISNLICHNLYGYLLKKFSATFLSFSGLTTPLFAALFGWIILRETVGWELFISILLFL